MILHELDETIRRLPIAQFDVTHGFLDLARPLATSKGIYRERAISIVRIETVDGVFGYGEAAPLEEWGTESATALVAGLDRLAANTPDTGGELLDRATGPAARFALETALLDLVARQRKLPLRSLFNPERSLRRVAVNATIGAIPAPDVRKLAAEYVERGFECIKLKVGLASHDDDIARVHAAKASGALLRIDANGAWTEEEAIAFLDRVSVDLPLEYCEQPVGVDPPEMLGHVAASTPVPIAADESCHPWPRVLDVMEMRSADILVLKPMVIGGLIRCLELHERALRQEISVVFTSSIDGAIARCAVAQLVASLDAPLGWNAPRHHGLATGHWFERDVAELELDRGHIALPDGHGLGIWPVVNALRTASR